MPRPTLFRHPKFQRLVRQLGLPAPYVLGHLEYLWQVGYDSGNAVIGDETDVEIAAHWVGAPGVLAGALQDRGFLDRLEDGRLQIHDLLENAPTYVQDRFKRESERKLSKVCAHCGGEFRSSDSGAKFCSPACRAANWRATGGKRDGQTPANVPNVRNVRVTFANATPAHALTPTPALTPAHTHTAERSDERSGGQRAVMRPLHDGPLARTHGQHAWCSLPREGFCVPRFLHLEFVGKRGGTPFEGEVLAWYPRVMERYAGQPVGDRPLDFWRNEFAAWVGTVTSAPAPPGRGTQSVRAAQRALTRLTGGKHESH